MNMVPAETMPSGVVWRKSRIREMANYGWSGRERRGELEFANVDHPKY